MQENLFGTGGAGGGGERKKQGGSRRTSCTISVCICSEMIHEPRLSLNYHHHGLAGFMLRPTNSNCGMSVRLAYSAAPAGGCAHKIQKE